VVQLLESNVVLETFGNAETVRSFNSSRFGKYVEVLMNSVGEVKGSLITSYLLEKTRVVTQAKVRGVPNVVMPDCDAMVTSLSARASCRTAAPHAAPRAFGRVSGTIMPSIS
jgi:hypothetical protein